ncbi:MAG: hypothetical protein QM705_02260 [Ancrocorticia sp.]
MTSTNNAARIVRLLCVFLALVGILVGVPGVVAVAASVETAPAETVPAESVDDPSDLATTAVTQDTPEYSPNSDPGEPTSTEQPPADPAPPEITPVDLPPVVVIMTGGLRWDSFDPAQTPAIAALAASGTMANMVPVISRGGSCPLDSWLALSAGRQTAPVALSRPWMCGQQWVLPGRSLARWGEYQTTISASRASAQLGTFAQILSDSGVTSRPIGPGAAHVLATGDGVVPGNYLLAPRSNESLAERVSQSAAEFDVTVVDAYPVDYSSITRWLATRLGLQSPEREQQESAAAADLNAARVETVVSALAPGTRVLLVSLTDVDSLRYMQMVVAADVPGAAALGADSTNMNDDASATDKPAVTTSPLPPSIGYSDSVRQRGVVQLSDLTPMLLSWLGIEDAPELTGTPMLARELTSPTCAPDGECFTQRLDDLADQGRHASAMRMTRGEFIRFLTWGAVGYFVLSLVLLARRPAQYLAKHPRIRTLWMWLGVTLASVPVVSLLLNALPWWNTSFAKLALIGGSWLVAGGVAYAALAARRWHIAAPLLLLSTLTAVVFLADAATGSRLMADSPVGFNLLNAARFYGVGNEAFALLATGTLTVLAFLGVWLRDRRKGRLRGRWPAVLLVGGIGLWVAAVDALPSMGADFGGVLSFVPALLVLIALVGRFQMSFVRVAIIGVVTVVAAAGIAIADWMRPPAARSHLGRFVQSIADGELFEVITRKLGTNLRLLMGSTHRWVVLAAILLIALALIHALRTRPVAKRTGWTRYPLGLIDRLWGWLAPSEGDALPPLVVRLPALKPALLANGTCLVLAFALNDSGIVLPGMAAILFVPLLQALIVSDQELRHPTQKEQ